MGSPQDGSHTADPDPRLCGIDSSAFTAFYRRHVDDVLHFVARRDRVTVTGAAQGTCPHWPESQPQLTELGGRSGQGLMGAPEGLELLQLRPFSGIPLP